MGGEVPALALSKARSHTSESKAGEEWGSKKSVFAPSADLLNAPSSAAGRPRQAELCERSHRRPSNRQCPSLRPQDVLPADRGRLENESVLLLRTNNNIPTSWAMSPGQLWYGGHHCPAQLSLPQSHRVRLAQGSDNRLGNGRDGDPGDGRCGRCRCEAPAGTGTGGVIPNDLIILSGQCRPVRRGLLVSSFFRVVFSPGRPARDHRPVARPLGGALVL
ncbi:hypothetical protein T492DRAFT_51443 [Pavlovales sp. CCMP2436]|nr:hypothetical protein T492DRAFT_51443 [Pavlovales sp. CCMP2436]